MNATQIQDALSGYVEQVRSAAFHEGRIAGRKEARDELRFFFDKFEEAFPIEPVVENRRPRSRRRKADDVTEPAEMVWLPPDEVAPLVKTALAVLATLHPEGASPARIAEHLRPGGQPINDQAVRQALRQLTLQGAVRRVAHARYLPAEPPPPADVVAQQPQAEAAE